ncbi:phage head closure protein [Paenochrobactrum pullorum]|uniref:phage head closure protein n=1 Tax=Paenochrobactrum pullorum TaxID=1324351 RepID=UPI0035BC9304
MNTLFMSAGRLRTELKLEELKPQADGIGGYTESWQEIALIWGQIRAITSSSRFLAQRWHPETTHRITIRFDEMIKAGMRLRRGSRIFQIDAIQDADETRRYQICFVREETT